MDTVNEMCSRMAALELSSWAFTLAHFDGIHPVQVNLTDRKEKAKAQRSENLQKFVKAT